MSISDILIELMAAVEDGLPRDLAYYGGSRQGQTRRLVVIELRELENEMQVLEPDWPDPKIYRLHKILWITDRLGRRIENKEAIQRRAEFLSSNESRERSISLLKSGAKLEVPGGKKIELIAELPATVSGKPIKLYAIGHKVPALLSVKSNAFWPRTAMLTARDAASAERACEAIKLLISDDYVSLWKVLDIFLRSEITWPVWERFHRSVIAEGEKLRDLQPRLRDDSCNFNSNGNFRVDPYNQRLHAYDNSELLPPEAGPVGSSVDRIRLIESDDIDFSKLFELVHKSSAPLIARFMEVAFCGFRVYGLENSELSAEELDMLGKISLASTPLDAPGDAVLDTLPVSILRSVAKQFAVPKGISGRDGYRSFLLSQSRELWLDKLRGSPWPTGTFILLPPAGWSWQQYLDARHCYLEMLNALRTWVGNEPIHYQQERFYSAFV